MGGAFGVTLYKSLVQSAACFSEMNRVHGRRPVACLKEQAKCHVSQEQPRKPFSVWTRVPETEGKHGSEDVSCVWLSKRRGSLMRHAGRNPAP